MLMKNKDYKIRYLNKLHKISLENFKGFEKKANIEFSPGINLIYGKNSAGKSSIIQALRLMKQSYHMFGSNCHFHLVVPSYIRVPGSLNFPEGFYGIVNKKDLTKDLTLGYGTYGRGYFTKQKKNIRIHKFLEYAFNNHKNKKFPDIKRILINSKEIYEDKNNSEKPLTEFNLVLKKKQKFKKDKISKLITDLWKRSRGSGFNVEGYLDVYKKKSQDFISEEDLYFQYFDIDKSKFNFGEYRYLHSLIMKDPKKNIQKILATVEDGLAGIKGLAGTDLEKLVKFRKNKNKELDINAGEFSYIGKSDLKKLRSFIKSKDFLTLNKFNEFFLKDYTKKIKLIRHKDSFYDLTKIETDSLGQTKAQDSGVLPAPQYYCYLHDVIVQSISESSKNELDIAEIYDEALDNIRFSTRSISVVPGLRQLPTRYLRRGIEERFIGEGAENLGDILSRTEVKNNVNKWFDKFEIPYQIKTKLIGNYYEIKMRPKFSKKYDLSYRDVGLGYSLSLPLIITALTSKNSIIICEEPELHLHPKMQAQLMELFMYSSLVNSNQFIIETHSENLLLRAQKIIRKGMIIDNKNIPINLENIKIFNVFSSNNEGSKIQSIILNSDGEFKTHWKDGFFADRLDELF